MDISVSLRGVSLSGSANTAPTRGSVSRHENELQPSVSSLEDLKMKARCQSRDGRVLLQNLRENAIYARLWLHPANRGVSSDGSGCAGWAGWGVDGAVCTEFLHVVLHEGNLSGLLA